MQNGLQSQTGHLPKCTTRVMLKSTLQYTFKHDLFSQESLTNSLSLLRNFSQGFLTKTILRRRVDSFIDEK
jgi:hypothetical protein